MREIQQHAFRERHTLVVGLREDTLVVGLREDTLVVGLREDTLLSLD
jgi:hypothetical protein